MGNRADNRKILNESMVYRQVREQPNGAPGGGIGSSKARDRPYWLSRFSQSRSGVDRGPQRVASTSLSARTRAPDMP